MSKNGSFTNADVDALESIVEIKTRDYEELWISFLVGVADLTAFEVEFRTHPSGDYLTIASVTADYDPTPEEPVLGVSGDLTIAAFGATAHWIKLNVKAAHDVQIKAAGTSSTITGHYGMN